MGCGTSKSTDVKEPTVPAAAAAAAVAAPVEAKIAEAAAVPATVVAEVKKETEAVQIPPGLPGSLPEGSVIVFVLGGPGSGKGTQCSKIVSKYGYAHLSAGDLLRDEVASGSETGQLCDKIMKEGKLVPMQVTITLLKNAMLKNGGKKFLIDGFPRALDQMEAFESTIQPCAAVIAFDCPEKTMEERLISRGQSSGRADDNLATIKKRFDTFVLQSKPVIEHYKAANKCFEISSVPGPDDVFAEVSKAMDIIEAGKVGAAAANPTVDIASHALGDMPSPLPPTPLPTTGAAASADANAAVAKLEAKLQEDLSKLQKVQFGANEDIPGWFYAPEGAKAAGVILIQEWWGVTDEIKTQALQVAAQGYKVLIPDLYKGKLTYEKEEAHHNMSNLDFPNALEEIKQAVAFLKDKQGCAKVGAIGQCMGGALAFGGSVTAGFDAVAPFYGFNGMICPIAEIKCPILAQFGSEDKMAGFSDKATALKIEAELKEHGKDGQVIVHEGADHAFLNSDEGKSGELRRSMNFVPTPEGVREKAWAAVFEFFGKHLN